MICLRKSTIQLTFLVVVILLFITVSPFAIAQAPALVWQKSLGGTDLDRGIDIKVTKDMGYVVAGYTYSYNGDVSGVHGEYDCWIVKLNSLGAIQWQKALGGSSDDIAQSIQQTTDGGYIFTGYTTSYNGDVTDNHGNSDVWVVKLDTAGNIIWQKALGGTDSEFGNSVQETSDGSYIVGGYTASTNGDVTGNHGATDFWIVKLDASGTLLWEKTLGGTYIDDGYSISQTFDHGYIFVGASSSTNGDVTGNHGGSDCWIVKLDSTGNLEWEESLGGSKDDYSNSVRQTSEGGYIIAATSKSNDFDVSGHHGNTNTADYWLVKLSGSGSIQWQKSFGGTSDDNASSVLQPSDGNYIIGGFSTSNNGDVTGHYSNNDYWIVKADSAGNLKWEKSLGGSANDYGYAVDQAADASYIVAGYSYSNNINVSGNHGSADYWVVKLAADYLPPTISTSPMNASTFCPGDQTTVPFITGGSVPFEPGNIFTAELSDASGNFSNPVTIGSLNAIQPAPVSVIIPHTASGNNYRIRVKGSHPLIIGTDNGSDIAITCPTPTGLISSNLTSASVLLSWNAVSCADKYKIRYRPVGSTSWTNVSAPNPSKTINGLSASTTYEWSVRTQCASNPNAVSKYSPKKKFTTSPLKLEQQIIENVTDFDVSPNPLNTVSIVSIKLQEGCDVIVQVVDLQGRLIKTLINEYLETGTHEIPLEATELASGMYLLQFKSSNMALSRKLIVQ